MRASRARAVFGCTGRSQVANTNERSNAGRPLEVVAKMSRRGPAEATSPTLSFCVVDVVGADGALGLGGNVPHI